MALLRQAQCLVLTEGGNTSSVEKNCAGSRREGSNGNVSAGNESIRSGHKDRGCDGDGSNEIDRSGCVSTGSGRSSGDGNSNTAGGRRHEINGNVAGGKGHGNCGSGIGGHWNDSGDGISSRSNCGQSANSRIGSDHSDDAKGGPGRASNCSN